MRKTVAPRVGAWIETLFPIVSSPLLRSLPVWERGLKPQDVMSALWDPSSLPVWERGLKPHPSYLERSHPFVAPRVGAWIETDDAAKKSLIGKSLPVWERGLKHKVYLLGVSQTCRSPCGSVD